MQLPVTKQVEQLNQKIDALLSAITEKISSLESKIQASQLPIEETNEQRIARAQADIERAKAVLRSIAESTEAL